MTENTENLLPFHSDSLGEFTRWDDFRVKYAGRTNDWYKFAVIEALRIIGRAVLRILYIVESRK